MFICRQDQPDARFFESIDFRRPQEGEDECLIPQRLGQRARKKGNE
jgi:hypothetical protein